ncbi:putative ABC transporter permease subunit [Clostridium felsineum]|uniref:Uncharacterized protein n=1 Tax=Clostridium felsineum TaxID=36839 RepID=A0A1S8LUE7_9CLOT|nr:hypothetical protein [Clostridium felsineum]URZ09324.1 hypothetical protein CLROS_047400 [Clostridium felsineum]URZ14010.1 hypothetical protein CROST_047880 [Clostridium felsineum]
MKQLISLIKIVLKNSNSFLDIIYEREASLFSIILFILIIICLSWFTVGYVTYGIYNELFKIGAQKLLLSAALILISIITIMASTLYIISIFYFSKDIYFFIPLPISSHKILTSKFLVVLIYQYLINFLIFIPILSVYGYEMNESIVYYLYAIVIFLLVPMFPLILIAILIVIIMSFSNFSKYKRFMKISGSVLSLIFIFGCVLIAEFGGGLLNNYFKNSRNEPNSQLFYVFPYIKLAICAIDNSNNYKGLIYMFALIFMVLILFILFLKIGEKFYFTGIANNVEVFSKKTKLTEKSLLKYINSKNQFTACFMKEFKIIIRNPIYMINSLGIPLVIPFIIITSFVTQKNSVKYLNMIKNLENNNNLVGVFIGLVIVFIFIQVETSRMSLTSFSREGSDINYIKCVPVSYKKQILVKVIVASTFVIIPCCILLFLGIILFKISAVHSILIFLLTINMIFHGSLLGTLIDLKNPYLRWQTETQMMNQNFNIIIANITKYLQAGLYTYIILHCKPSVAEFVVAYLCIFVIKYLYIYKIFILNKRECFDNLCS